jgi:very-short-patch-repair endonuclease
MEKAVSKLGRRYRFQHLVASAKAILDFALIDDKINIEIDDPSHFTKAGLKKDRDRTEKLELLGWRVVRCTNDEALSSPEAALSKMLGTC